MIQVNVWSQGRQPFSAELSVMRTKELSPIKFLTKLNELYKSQLISEEFFLVFRRIFYIFFFLTLSVKSSTKADDSSFSVKKKCFLGVHIWWREKNLLRLIDLYRWTASKWKESFMERWNRRVCWKTGKKFTNGSTWIIIDALYDLLLSEWR